MKSRKSYAAAMASVDIEVAGLGEEGKYKDVIFVYEPAKIDRYVKKEMFTTISFFEIAGIIILLMTAIVLVYSLWNEGIRKLIGYQSQAAAELVEEDSHQGKEESSENQFEISKQEQVSKNQ